MPSKTMCNLLNKCFFLTPEKNKEPDFSHTGVDLYLSPANSVGGITPMQEIILRNLVQADPI